MGYDGLLRLNVVIERFYQFFRVSATRGALRHAMYLDLGKVHVERVHDE